VARFIRTYGPGMYRDARYPTRDKVIPWRLFQLMMLARRHVLAEERMHEAHAVGLAIARALNGDNPKVQAAGRAEEREAYPGG
jgi:hypothetical protein